GAGILSSTGEIPYSLFSPEVTRQPFVTDVVINTDYDPSRMQDRLFIAPSLPFLRRELEGLVRRFGLPVLLGLLQEPGLLEANRVSALNVGSLHEWFGHSAAAH